MNKKFCLAVPDYIMDWVNFNKNKLGGNKTAALIRLIEHGIEYEKTKWRKQLERDKKVTELKRETKKQQLEEENHNSVTADHNNNTEQKEKLQKIINVKWANGEYNSGKD